MRFLLHTCAVALLLHCLSVDCNGHGVDYGIGILICSVDSSCGIVYSNPSLSSDTVAMVWRTECLFHGDTERNHVSLVGFRKYDDWGLPILKLTRDSAWAQVVVESSDGTIRRKGWVHLRTPKTTIRIWGEFLATEPSMVLRHDKPLHFYSKPNENSPLRIRLFRFRSPFDEYSYILKPIRREGRWLLVELQTPFLPCNDEDSIVRDSSIRARTIRVWIQYLDERGRPLVRPPMMC